MHPNHSPDQPLGPTEILDYYTPGFSLDMDKGVSGMLHTLAQQGMSASRNFSPQTCVCDFEICTNFQAQNPSHCPETPVAFKTHNLHYDKTYK